MAVSFSCRCSERHKPIAERQWVVGDRNCHHSAFAGYHRTHSDYSTVFCLVCRACGRTKADYVSQLRDGVWTAAGYT